MSFGSRPEAEFEATAAFSGFETFSVDLPGGGGSVCTVRGGVVEGFGRASLGCGSADSAVLLFACWELLFAGAALSSWLAHAEVSAINANRTAYVINIERFIADKFSTKARRMCNEYGWPKSHSLPRVGPPEASTLSVTIVAPQPPASDGASLYSITKALRERIDRIISAELRFPFRE